jgi:hypothetical protein
MQNVRAGQRHGNERTFQAIHIMRGRLSIHMAMPALMYLSLGGTSRDVSGRADEQRINLSPHHPLRPPRRLRHLHLALHRPRPAHQVLLGVSTIIS